MKKVVSIAADLSAYYWVLTVTSLALGELNVWSAFTSFTALLVLKSLNRFRVPILTLAIDNASERFFDFLDWAEGSVVIRIRMRGGGSLRISLSLSAFAFAVTLALALARAQLAYLDYDKLAVLLIVFTFSTVFYRSNSTYIRAMGVAVPVFTAVVYATLVNLLVWLAIGGNGSLILSVLINFLAAVAGCDVSTIKWSVLNNARVLIIGGLGLYDAIILIPTASYLVSSLLITALGALPLG